MGLQDHLLQYLTLVHHKLQPSTPQNINPHKRNNESEKGGEQEEAEGAINACKIDFKMKSFCSSKDKEILSDILIASLKQGITGTTQEVKYYSNCGAD